MLNGTIKKVMPKGFGFIAPANGGPDIFFHSNGLVGTSFDALDPNGGQAVTYEAKESDRGDGRMNAVNVQLA